MPALWDNWVVQIPRTEARVCEVLSKLKGKGRDFPPNLTPGRYFLLTQELQL